MTTTTPTHEQERQAILKQYPQTYFAAAAALFIVIGILIGNALFGKGGLLTASDNGYLTNVFTEVASVLVTVIVIDRLNRRRDQQREERELKAQLVRDASSTSNEVAKNAVHQLNKREWLQGEAGLLKGENLRGANLQHSKLENANLQDVRLGDANLQDANLVRANLQDASMDDANLQDAKLVGANLQYAIMSSANLQGAHLFLANLQHTHLIRTNLQDAILSDAQLQAANLWNANLSGANLQGVKFDESTILPDGTNWTPDKTDQTRFTDPNHPNFWHSPVRGEDAPPPAPNSQQA
jgi:uncharacterized protein YjbI with pentapeptide repeats